jgi:integrase
MGKLRIYRRKDRGAVWQAQAYVGGRRYRFSCHTRDKATARQYAQQQLKELETRHNRGLVGLPEPVRMSQVLDRYKREALPKLRPASQRRTAGIVAQARAWFVQGPLRDPQLASVQPNDILAFLDAKRAEGVSPRTVNLYRATLHRIFRLCVRPWLLIPANPVAATETLREEPREPELITEAEYAALLRACNGHPMLQLFVTLAWETGARSGELLQLEWSDVDLERRLVKFANDPQRGRQTKGRRSRTVPLSVTAIAALRDHGAQFRLLAPPSPYVFKHLRPDRSAQPGDRIERLYRSFRKAARAICLDQLRPHDLRHSFVTRKLAEGVPVQLVSRYVGHADLATTLRYTHLIPEHMRAVVSAAGQSFVEMGTSHPR